MSTPKTQAELESLIGHQVEERIDLEYKRANSLGRSDAIKREIVKDVSAMANAAGGTIIYGIAEYGDGIRKHLPEKLDPIRRSDYSREWLDQIIAGIRPKIEGLKITAIPLDSGSDDTAYTVEVPQGATAHQALDGKYYKRLNFTTDFMLDHEIRDVMARASYPIVELKFKMRIESWSISGGEGFGLGRPEKKKRVPRPFFEVEIYNSSRRLANYVTAWLKMPIGCLDDLPHNCTSTSGNMIDGTPCDVICLVNRHRDIIGHRPVLTYSSPIYSEPYFHPILPSLDHQLAHLKIEGSKIKSLIGKPPGFIEWEVQADNAPRKEGKIAISDIENIWEYQSEKP